MRRRPPAGRRAPIVMVVDARGDLCTGTALARDLVLTAAHCVARAERLRGEGLPDRRADPRALGRAAPALRSRAATPPAAPPPTSRSSSSRHRLPDIVVPAALAAPRRVKVGETLTIAGFGTVAAGTARGLRQPRDGQAHRHRPAGLAADPSLRQRDAQPAPRPRRLHRRFRRARLSTAKARW